MANSFFSATIRKTLTGFLPFRQSDPSPKQVMITPGASELADWPRTLRIGDVSSGGTIVYVDAYDNEITLNNCTAGEYIPAVVKKVLAESSDSPAVSTTAANIVGFI